LKLNQKSLIADVPLRASYRQEVNIMKTITVPAELITAYKERIKALEELVAAHENHNKHLEESRNEWRTATIELCKQLKEAEAEKEAWKALYSLSN